MRNMFFYGRESRQFSHFDDTPKGFKSKHKELDATIEFLIFCHNGRPTSNLLMWSVVIIECDESRIFAHPVKTLILYLCLEIRYFGYGFRCDGTYIVLLYPIHVMTIAIYTLLKIFFFIFYLFCISTT